MRDLAFIEDEQPYYYKATNNNNNTLRNGGFSQRMRESASRYLAALDNDDGTDAIQKFEKHVKNLSKNDIDSPLYGILNTQQNRQEVDTVIKYLAKVADVCYMAAKRYGKKLEECEKILEVCETYTAKRIAKIQDEIKIQDEKTKNAEQILAGISYPTITAAQNPDLDSELTDLKSKDNGGKIKKKTLAFSVSPVAFIKRVRKIGNQQQLESVLKHFSDI
jgi:hypothetical protein